jgi:hypothetical protein
MVRGTSPVPDYGIEPPIKVRALYLQRLLPLSVLLCLCFGVFGLLRERILQRILQRTILLRGDSMDREEVRKISLGKSTKQPLRIPVEGLPDHLQADIVVAQGWYKFSLRRGGDVHPYEQNPTSASAEAALQALRNLLNWDPKDKKG